MELNMGNYSDKIIRMILDYGPRLIMVVVSLIIGLWLIKKVVNFVRKAMESQGLDASLIPFLTSLISVLLKVTLIISVASTLGFETTSLVAVLGAASLAIGLALQGSLSNFAGGVLILIFKPYKVGDLIEAQGHFGEVLEIQVFNTILVNAEEKTIILPNGSVSNCSIINRSKRGFLRVDTVVGISYGDDINTAKAIIEKTLLSDPKVLKDPAPVVRVMELGDNSVNFAVRPYASVDNYWDVYFNTYENVKYALDEAKISIPFPQRDVHIIKE